MALSRTLYGSYPLRVWVLLLLPLLVPRLALAQPAPAEGGWKFSVALYGWLSNVDGDVAVFGAPPTHTSKTVSDLLDQFKGAVMGLAEARNGRFMFGADVLWAQLSQKEDVNLDPLAAGVEVTNENWMVTAVAGYAVMDTPRATLDAVVGARFWSVDNKIEFRGGTLDGQSVSDTETWTDPLIGLNGKVDLTERLYLTGWALVGSDSMWDVMAALGYRFSKRWSAIAGYRALSVDYKNDAFVYDVTQSGVMIGGTVRF